MDRVSRWKCAVGAASMLLAGAAWSSARAGNLDLPLPTCLYYSVMLQAGEAFRYTGTEGDYTLTVDDITYTVAIDPCDLFERCAFFPESEITAAFSDSTRFEPPTITGPTTAPGFAGGISTSTSFSQNSYLNQVITKGAYLRLEMYEGPLGVVNTGGDLTFDAVSHSVYGTFLEKMKERKASSQNVTVFGIGPEEGITATAVATHAMTDSIAVSTWAVQTSESRHYQSPQIVQRGGETNSNYVCLMNTGAATDYGVYQQAQAMVKGRVWVGSTGAPVETFDIEVTTP